MKDLGLCGFLGCNQPITAVIISSYDTELLVSWHCIQGLVPAKPLLSGNANECLSPGIIDLEGKTLARAIQVREIIC